MQSRLGLKKIVAAALVPAILRYVALATLLLLHPMVYFGLALLIGPWSVLVARVHQGIGLAGHIRFSRKQGFTWYAVDDPERYIALSKAQFQRPAA